MSYDGIPSHCPASDSDSRGPFNDVTICYYALRGYNYSATLCDHLAIRSQALHDENRLGDLLKQSLWRKPFFRRFASFGDEANLDCSRQH
jgi:hypothetical protein